MNKPPWLRAAERDIGQRETLAPNDSPWIRRMWARVAGAWLLGQPWCGGAVAYWLSSQGIRYPADYYRAMAWSTWGSAAPGPLLGAVAVFRRDGGGHVGLVAGVDQRGRVMVLGGNQGNAVSVAPFDVGRVIAYRWPPGVPLGGEAPQMASSASSSTNEA